LLQFVATFDEGHPKCPPLGWPKFATGRPGYRREIDHGE
jgi:hypothetical protein